jgi:hypothetical protein
MVAEATMVSWSVSVPARKYRSLFELLRLLAAFRPKPPKTDVTYSRSRRPQSPRIATIARCSWAEAHVSWHDRLVHERTEVYSLARRLCATPVDRSQRRENRRRLPFDKPESRLERPRLLAGCWSKPVRDNITDSSPRQPKGRLERPRLLAGC